MNHDLRTLRQLLLCLAVANGLHVAVAGGNKGTPAGRDAASKPASFREKLDDQIVFCMAQGLATATSSDELEADTRSLDYLQDSYVRQLEEKLRLDASNVGVRSRLANVLAVLGKFPEAAYHFDRLLEHPLSQRSRWAALNNYGNLHFLRDSLKQAERSYRMALETDSTGSETFLNLGTLYSALGDSQTAVEMYRHVVQDSAKASVIHTIFGSDEGDDEKTKASGSDPKKEKKRRVKKEAKANLKSAGHKNRSTGRKGAETEFDMEASNDIGELLYWAEVK